MQIYCGKDFATTASKDVECLLFDDGSKLSFALRAPTMSEVVDLTAVDCPLGTSKGFLDLLSGKNPVYSAERGEIESRFTERWIRSTVGSYAVVKFWKDRPKGTYPRKQLFNASSHVQPTVGMRTVPACLRWLIRSLGTDASPETCLAAVRAARRGEGTIVEAHPRMFLYSALERIHRIAPLPLRVLHAAACYKRNGKSVLSERQATRHRRLLYYYLSGLRWSGPHKRMLEGHRGNIVRTDHAFDAFLAALTAWAHHQDLTIRWTDVTLRGVRLDKPTIDDEGHLLVLKQL